MSLEIKIGADKQIHWKGNNIKIKHISALDFWHVSKYSYLDGGITETVPPGPGKSEGTIWILRSQKVQGEREGKLRKGGQEGNVMKGDDCNGK